MKKPIPFTQIGILLHKCSEKFCASKKHLQKPYSLFDLSSHARAREAIIFALKMRHKTDHHVFVVGDARAGRMKATLRYLEEYTKKLPAPLDWVYVNNFSATHQPLPFDLPTGQAEHLKRKTKILVQNIWVVLNRIFKSEDFHKQIDKINHRLQRNIDKQTQQLQNLAKSKGFELVSRNEGLSLEEVNNDENFLNIHKKSKALETLQDNLSKLSLAVTLANQKIEQQIDNIKRTTAKKAIDPLFQVYKDEFGQYLKGWIEDFRRDVLKNIYLFFDEENTPYKIPKHTLERYAINVIVGHNSASQCPVIVESNLTYENLFGQIKYRNNETTGSLETNFTLIRPGALHRANGGILVLRAEELEKNPDVWDRLKATLLDKKIMIQESYKEGTPLLDEEPRPIAIPLDVQIFLIMSSLSYYTFFYPDPDFANYFKIRAEIEPVLPATKKNIRVYQHLLHTCSLQEVGRDITPAALDYLTGYSTRWAGDQHKLSARFELFIDILKEAEMLIDKRNSNQPIDIEHIVNTLNHRRRRNSHHEDSVIEDMHRNLVVVETKGKKVGLVNGLTVLNLGDRSFGVPVRISARTSVGEEGVINIERLIDMGGPIQQKGAFILEGFLKGVFAQQFPLSCSCSLTFEQNYTDVEGDSASMAELIAILSSLANVPIRQDLAVTGSLDQFGNSQAVGGVHQKIEGFHRLCKERNFTGTQGVIIPKSNVVNLTVRPDVVEDIKNGHFTIWSVDTIYDAIELMTGMNAGVSINQYGQVDQKFSKGSVFAKVFETLKRFDKFLKHKH